MDIPLGYWSYPSDHLPIGIEISFEKEKSIKCVSWNVLNSLWIKYIEENSQGLKTSAITDLNHKEQLSSDYTLREFKVLEIIEKILTGCSPEILCLQECSLPMVELIALRINTLFENQYGIFTTEKQFNDAGMVIYKKQAFDDAQAFIHHGLYESDRDNYLMEMSFKIKNSPHIFVLIATHIPYDKYQRSKENLANYLKDRLTKTPIVLIGDLNQVPDAFESHLNEILLIPFAAKIPSYFTHINTSKEKVIYDYVLTRGIEKAEPLSAEIIDRDLKEMIDRLLMNQ